MKDRLAKISSGRIAFIVRLIGTTVALALLVYLLSQQGWAEIGSAIAEIEPWVLVLALGLMLVSRLAVAARWHALLHSSQAIITYGQSLRITFAGLFATNFLPTTIGGDVVRLAGALQLRLDAAVSAASLIADRLVGMAGMVMVVPFGLPRFLEVARLGRAHPGEIPISLAGSVAFPGARWLKNIWTYLRNLIARVLRALSMWLKQPRSLLVALLFTWVNMLCLFSVIYLLFAGMGEHVSFWQTAGLYSIVYFITLLPLSINGYGIQEVSMTFVFSSVGGASWQSGLTAALLFRTIMMITSLPGALFAPGLLLAARKQGHEEAGSD